MSLKHIAALLIATAILGGCTKPGGRDYNQFLDPHRAVWTLEERKCTTKFVPEMIVFKDGTKLLVPK